MTRNAYDAFEIDTSTGTAGLAEGERRRDAATALLAETRAWLVRCGCRLFVRQLLKTGTATADDIARGVQTAPGIDRRLLGAVPLTLAKAGVAELDGYQRSTRPERHASVIAVWRLTDRAAALAWLDKNPPLPEPDDRDADDLDANAGRRQARLAFLDDEPATVAAAAGSFLDL